MISLEGVREKTRCGEDANDIIRSDSTPFSSTLSSPSLLSIPLPNMRSQGFWRSFGLLRHAYTRSYLNPAFCRRAFQTVSSPTSPPRVPDFAFAFE